jgi:hypothetical protein
MIARSVLAVQVTGAILAVLVMAVSLVAYLPFAPAVEIAALGVGVAGMAVVFARLGRTSIDGAAFNAYRRAASAPVKRWAVATLAVAAAVLGAGAVSGRALPAGDVARSDGGYIETVHGAVTAHLTRAEYRDEQMTNLRFMLLAGTVLLVFGGVMTAGMTVVMPKSGRATLVGNAPRP